MTYDYEAIKVEVRVQDLLQKRPGRRSQYQNAEEKFWAKTDTSAGPDGCWPWKDAVTQHAYDAQIAWRENGKTRVMRAHRFAWEMTYGPIPKGMRLHNTCFSSNCVNPRHWELVTRARAYDLAVVEGRRRCKEALSEAQVIAIRQDYLTMDTPSVARKYDMPVYCVKRIVTGEAYRDYGGPVLKLKRYKTISPAIEQRILELHRQGVPQGTIAEEVGIHYSTCSLICRGKYHGRYQKLKARRTIAV